MLIAGAVCPHPPLLIPAALGAAASSPPAELRKVAAAAGLAVRGLLASRPDLVVVVGAGTADLEYGGDAAGGLHDFGIPLTVGLGEPVLPLPLTVGRWLLERAGANGRAPGADGRPGAPRATGEPAPLVVFQEVDQRGSASRCARLGAALAARAQRVAMLAMGDASARRARGEPGAGDPAAQDYDCDVAEALAAADTQWLARLDPALADQLGVAGRAAWQVLGGAAAGCRLQGRLLCMTAPYGVTYLVASWEGSHDG